MKIKENQYDRYYKVSVLFIAFVSGLAIFFLPEQSHFLVDDKSEAQAHAKMLAEEILQRKSSEVVDASETKLRLPASVEEVKPMHIANEGKVGLDPWGQPYQYSVLETDMGVARVVVQTQNDKNELIQSYVEGHSEPVDAQDLQPEF